MLFLRPQRLLNARFWLLILIGLLCISATAQYVSGQESDPGVNPEAAPTVQADVSPTVFNGSQATPHEFPWMVAIRFFDYYYPGTDCGGALIHPQWILTAAHCFYDFEDNYIGEGFMDIRLGEHNLLEDDGNEILLGRSDVESIHLYPGYNISTFGVNDIALMKLKVPVTLNGDIGLLPLAGPDDAALEAEGQAATVAGWGWVSNTPFDASDLLQKLTYNIIVQSGCEVNSGVLCMDSANTSSSCSGDSGGPLFAQNSDGAWRQLGIVSGGAGRCGTGTDTYTRVSHYRDWLGTTASLPLCPAGGVIYVDADRPGGGDGLSWATAYNSLADALAVTEPCQVWVAEGTYKPTASTDRNATLSLSPGLALYGGFSGSETALDQRDWTANPTIISGDLDGDDDANSNGTIDVGEEPTGNNSYNIFTLDGTASSIFSTTVIDGFTISGGLADHAQHDSGAGLRCYAGGNGTCRPALRNLIFIGNKAVNGGAMLNHGQDDGTASPRMRNVAFRHNVATEKGGAIYNLADGPGSQAAPYIMRAAFTDNRSTGISVYSGGGAIYNQYDMETNSSDGLYLVNGLFLRNSAANDGGAIYNRVFDGFVSTYMAFVTMADNSADNGGGIFSQTIGATNSFNQTIGSSILWNNTASESGPQIYIEGADNSVNVSYSLVGGGDAGIVGSTAFRDGTGNIDADPRFRDSLGRIGTNSPAIDAAQAGNLPEDLADWPDMDGNMRIVDVRSIADTGAYFSNFQHNAVPDMGAYEFNSRPCPTGSRLYVDRDAGGGGLTGESWADAYVSASNGLEAAQLCDNISEVWVAEGVYTPPAAGATFVLRPGLSLYGGFNGSETSTAGRDLAANPTILSGDVDGNDLNSDGNQIAESTDQIQGTNSKTVVTLRQADWITDSNRIDGFTITAGNGATDGAGLYCFTYQAGCSLALANLTFAGNYATNNGGGLHVESWYVPSDVTLTDVTFRGNRAGQLGGGLHWKSHATGTGAGEESRLVIRNGRFENNQADSGGGVYIHGNSGVSLSTLTNMAFSGNSTSGAGGAIYIGDNSDGSMPFNLTLTNATASNNTAGTTGGAIMGDGSAGATVSADLDNVILWGNQDSTGPNEVNLVGQSTMSLDTSIVQGGNGGIVDDGSATPFGSGTGNLNADPLFVDGANGNLRLQSTSPAVDAGNNAAIAGASTDLDGYTRIFNGTVDMGAYESQVPFAASTSTATPTATATATSTSTSIPTATGTPTQTSTSTPTATPTQTSTSTPTATPVSTTSGQATSTPTMTPTPTATEPAKTTSGDKAIYLPIVIR